MDIFSFYSDESKHGQLADLLVLGAQQHPDGLGQNFLEKDIWVTEILRLLYNENLLGDIDVAFKGGTALSKCWNAIGRFSEDIDLSIHWADLAEEEDEAAAWAKSTQSRSQRDKFRKRQTDLLTEWSTALTETLNKRFEKYGIKGLHAELEADSSGEKIDIHFPSVTSNDNTYQLDHVLLEFGGRNRGRPTVEHNLRCYLAEIGALDSIKFPEAKVQAYDPNYIVWEKLTALHQFSTQTKDPNPYRLSRHWYDVDCILSAEIATPISNEQAMRDVVEMKSQRWAQPGVDYELVLSGGLVLVPEASRLASIKKDYQESVAGKMFFSDPDDFDAIVERISIAQTSINQVNKG